MQKRLAAEKQAMSQRIASPTKEVSPILPSPRTASIQLEAEETGYVTMDDMKEDGANGLALSIPPPRSANVRYHQRRFLLAHASPDSTEGMVALCANTDDATSEEPASSRRERHDEVCRFAASRRSAEVHEALRSSLSFGICACRISHSPPSPIKKQSTRYTRWRRKLRDGALRLHPSKRLKELG